MADAPPARPTLYELLDASGSPVLRCRSMAAVERRHRRLPLVARASVASIRFTLPDGTTEESACRIRIMSSVGRHRRRASCLCFGG
jgi:hypothetical protein